MNLLDSREVSTDWAQQKLKDLNLDTMLIGLKFAFNGFHNHPIHFKNPYTQMLKRTRTEY